VLIMFDLALFQRRQQNVQGKFGSAVKLHGDERKPAVSLFDPRFEVDAPNYCQHCSNWSKQ